MAGTTRSTPKKNSTKSTTRTHRTTGDTMSLPTREEIARRAHELYVTSGRPAGRDVEFWLEAERQLRDEGDR